MSARIIPFIPRARSLQQETPNPFRSPSRVDDLVMDHVDTAPCEICPPYVLSHVETEPD